MTFATYSSPTVVHRSHLSARISFVKQHEDRQWLTQDPENAFLLQLLAGDSEALTTPVSFGSLRKTGPKNYLQALTKYICLPDKKHLV